MIFIINLTRGQMRFLACVARVTCLVLVISWSYLRVIVKYGSVNLKIKMKLFSKRLKKKLSKREFRGFAKLKNSKIKLDRAHNTLPPPIQTFSEAQHWRSTQIIIINNF